MADFCDEKMTMMTTLNKDRSTKKFQDRVVSILIYTELVITLYLLKFIRCIGKLDRADKKGRVIKICGHNQSKLDRVR